jgi:predicted 3-demethylubiquinone-9 3-methyltransferase (glyoxalase superfamily)
MQKIVPNLWFDTQAEEAAKFYTSIFKNSRITNIMYYTEAGPGPAGSVLTVAFELEGQAFIAINGGPHFKFTPAISLMVNCQDQAEIDELWARLSAIPEAEQCGWVADKYGLSWQIVPAEMDKMIREGDPVKLDRLMAALLKMKKLDLAALKHAYEG